MAWDSTQTDTDTISHTEWNDMVTYIKSVIDESDSVDTGTLKIDGTEVTATAAELNYVDGVTSNIQTQLDNTRPPFVTVGFSNADYICDGTADDVQIQAAIDSLSSGGVVFIKQGTYDISSTVTGASNLSICGEGNSTILTLSNNVNSNVIKFDTVTNAHISNLRIIGNSNNQSGGGVHGLLFDTCSDCSAKGLDISDVYQAAIAVDNSTRIVFSENNLYNFVLEGYYITNNSSQVSINSSTMHSSNSDAIQLKGNVADISITNCLFYDNNRHIFMWDGDLGQGDVSSVSISNNILNLSQRSGIDIADSTSNVSISNNIIKNSNTSDTSKDGIGIGDTSQKIIISNNIIFDDRTPKKQRYGVRATSNTNYISCLNNNLLGNLTGAFAIDSSIIQIGHNITS